MRPQHTTNRTIGRFRKDWLPRPEDFYSANVEQFRNLRGHRGLGLCPFHPDRDPSLQIDLDRGLYYCHPCGIGGDIVDFVQRRDGLSFKDAAKVLHAWDGSLRIDAVVIHAIETARVQQELERQHEEELCQEYFAAEDQLYSAEGIYADAATRLSELRRGARESFPEQTEVCWSILAHECDEVRAAESAFVRARLAWPAAPHNHTAKAWRDRLG